MTAGVPRNFDRKPGDVLTIEPYVRGSTIMWPSAETSVQDCGGRRMAEHAATLVDGLVPRVPVRQ